MAKLDPTLKSAVEAAYKLGIMDGEKRRCRHCESKLAALMQTTNSELWESLSDLDDEYPKLGIVLSFREAYFVLKALFRGKKCPYYANLLNKRVKEKQDNLPNLLEILEKGWPDRFKAAMEYSNKKKRKK